MPPTMAAGHRAVSSSPVCQYINAVLHRSSRPAAAAAAAAAAADPRRCCRPHPLRTPRPQCATRPYHTVRRHEPKRPRSRHVQHADEARSCRVPRRRASSSSSSSSSSIETATSAGREPSYDSLLRVLEETHRELCDSKTAIRERDVIDYLDQCHQLGQTLPLKRHAGNEVESVAATAMPKAKTVSDSTSSAASALFSLSATQSPTEGKTSTAPQAKKSASSAQVQSVARKLSDLAQSLLLHPTVFIGPGVLAAYIRVCAALRDPRPVAAVFDAFANKAIPVADKTPIRYLAAKPHALASAIPAELADKALDIALETRDFDAAVGIIEASYGTEAFRRRRFVRRGGVPLAALALFPLAAWTTADRLALVQHTLQHESATKLAFAGILAYVGFTGTLGFVALTTGNDQMDRVTWAAGVRLRERWLREEERAAVDRVAGAWGFRERWRRGDEQGREWDALREYCGAKGMELDRIELMDGMQ